MTDEISATFWEHIEELRSVLIRALLSILIGLSLALYYSNETLAFIKSTLPNLPLALFSPQEGFLSTFKLAFWLGFLATSPYWTWGILRFLIPGLRGKIKVMLPGFLFLSFLFIATGLALCLFLTLPLANQYFYEFNSSIGTNIWSFGAYVDFILMLLFAHGTAFEIGALLLLLIHIGALKWETLAAKRRHAIVVSLIVGALLTPPDVLTQILIALPLLGFFELAILYGKVFFKEQ